MTAIALRPRTVDPQTAFALALAFALGTGACVGNVTPAPGQDPAPSQPGPGSGAQPGSPNPSQPGNSSGPGVANPATQMPAPPSVVAGGAPLRRLSSEQYRNTVRDLLGFPAASLTAVALPADDTVDDRFASNGKSLVKEIDFGRYADAANELAKRAVGNLGALTGCDEKAMGPAACGKRFIESFGRRAYRRPLRSEEVARLEKVLASGETFAEGVELVVSALLQSPKFLYLVEPVPASAIGKIVAVDPFALASRLSYFMLGSMPDEALLLAAEKGQLDSPDAIATQATRLAADVRFRENVGSFHRQWLLLHQIAGAEKDAKLYPTFDAPLRVALAEESRRFVEHVMANEGGKLETLLSAPFSVLGGPLFDYYGVPRPAGTDWQKTALPATERAGLLTHGSMLAAQAHTDRTSFILRGKLVREAIFCTPVPPPPPNAANDEVMVPATATAKERALAHRNKPECASCHALFDPIGFSFEAYDAAGRFRKTEANGQPIDTALDLTSTKSLDGRFTGALDLITKIASADEVRDCVARQWMRFALGREEGGDDVTSLAAASARFRDSGKLADLVAALARSDSFRFQRVLD